MEHCDPETLAVSALGETALDGADAEHLLGCPRCAEELAQLCATVRLARGTDPDRPDAPAEDPPDRVWTALSAELGLSAGSSSGPGSPKPSSGRRRRRWALVAAAALIAACSGLAGAAVRGGDQPTPAPLGQLVAQASLGALHSDSAGSARWIDAPGGAVLEVQLSADELESAVGYLEVWLLDPDTHRLVSLGLLPPSARSGETATLPVPTGIDPGDYAFVDVSDEPLDGDPSHSGVSVARGDLRPAD